MTDATTKPRPKTAVNYVNNPPRCGNCRNFQPAPITNSLVPVRHKSAWCWLHDFQIRAVAVCGEWHGQHESPELKKALQERHPSALTVPATANNTVPVNMDTADDLAQTYGTYREDDDTWIFTNAYLRDFVRGILVNHKASLATAPSPLTNERLNDLVTALMRVAFVDYPDMPDDRPLVQVRREMRAKINSLLTGSVGQDHFGDAL